MAPLDRGAEGRPRRHARAACRRDDSAVAAEVDGLAERLNILATIGSVAPFVGLFGTVWGIMNSFIEIAGSQNTSLAVVAPGISEALFATALGPVRGDPGGDRLQPLQPRVNRFEARLQRFADKASTPRSSRELERSVMAMGLNASSRGAAAAARRRAPMAEINVTPMVDVMLVLLIIFMVTAPLLVAGVPVELPDSRAKRARPGARPDHDRARPRRGPSSSTTQLVPEGGFAAALGRVDRAAASEAPLITLRADRALDYGRVMAVMGELNRAGLQQDLPGHPGCRRAP